MSDEEGLDGAPAEGLHAMAAGEEDGDQQTVKPGDVDAFWLQRVLNKHYNDADVSQVIKSSI